MFEGILLILGTAIVFGVLGAKIFTTENTKAIYNFVANNIIPPGVLMTASDNPTAPVKTSLSVTGIDEKIDRFFDREDTVSSVPNPTELLANGGPVVDNGNDGSTDIHTHSVPVIPDTNDVVVNGRDFNDATTRLVQLAVDLLHQPANQGVSGMPRRNAHMQVDVARRILAQATTLIGNSQDVPHE